MKVYRITLAQYALKLYAPGTAARWNSEGRFVIYTAGSVSLACLENLVHRNAAALQTSFRLMYIEIPTGVPISELPGCSLGKNWEQDYALTRKLGNQWLDEQPSPVLKVPSAIVQEEFNYLLNPAHVEFSQISLLGSEAFSFDQRLKV
jgi:RES domain-containing protein